MDYLYELQSEMTLSFWLLNVLSVIFADIIFFVRLRRREHFALRAVCSTAGWLIFFFFLSPVVVHYVARGASWWLAFILSIAAGCVCFKHKFVDVVFCVTGALAVQNTGNLIVEHIGYLAVGGMFTGWLLAVVYIPVVAAVDAAAYFLFARRIKKGSAGIMKNKYAVVAVSVILLMSATGYLNYLPHDTVLQNWLTRGFRIGINMVVILLMLAYRHNKDLMDEKAVMQAVIAKGNEQFRAMKDYMEVIDIKCHDIKKFMQMQNFREGANREIASELIQSVEEYRNTPKTGVAALDVVLYDKIIICKKNDITLTYMIDGDDLGTLKPVDIATIFNNLLYNAIEYVKTLDEKEKRLISLNVHTKYNCLFIIAENYCEHDLRFMGGLPVTSKGLEHGFGLKSVKYAVESYGGTLAVQCADGLFSVNILIPLKS